MLYKCNDTATFSMLYLTSHCVIPNNECVARVIVRKNSHIWIVMFARALLDFSTINSKVGYWNLFPQSILDTYRYIYYR